MKGHADAETLAAYREGLLPRHKARRVAAHLAGCPRCAGLDAQLAGLPALLAHSPAPPMPAALTARIEAALAAEAAARSATAGTGAGAAHADADVTGSRRRSRPVLRIAVAAVAAAAVAGGAGYGLSQLTSGGPRTASRTVAGPAFAEPKGAGHEGAAHEGAAPGNGRLASPEPIASLRVVSSGTNYQPGRLQAQVRALLARFGTAPARAGAAGHAAPVNAAADHLAACVTRVAGDQRPRLVDVARYRGAPAVVIVVPAASGTGLRVWVVGRDCSATTSHPLASTSLRGLG